MQATTEWVLDYSTAANIGISRSVRAGKTIYHFNGRMVRTRAELQRIAALAIPPAWTDVRICTDPRGHLQAIGRDARGRKQYRYHPAWIAERDSNKFESLATFARTLPRIRRCVRRDLALATLAKRRVLAAIVQLMDRTFIRVGDERYRRENGSFGATTLRSRHVRIQGAGIHLDFRGKSGKRHRIDIEDRRIARVVRRCLDLPGDALFQYRDGDDVKSISPTDVNEYLREISGTGATSKDFRTWGGTLHAARYLAQVGRPDARSQRRAHVREALQRAAGVLGNTAAVCRRSYVHPRVFICYEGGIISDPIRVPGLRAGECATLALLRPTERQQARRVEACTPRRRVAGATPVQAFAPTG